MIGVMLQHEQAIRADGIVSRLRVRGTIARLRANNNNKTHGGNRETGRKGKRKMRVLKREET